MGLQKPGLNRSIPTDVLEVLLNTQVIILSANMLPLTSLSGTRKTRHFLKGRAFWSNNFILHSNTSALVPSSSAGIDCDLDTSSIPPPPTKPLPKIYKTKQMHWSCTSPGKSSWICEQVRQREPRHAFSLPAYVTGGTRWLLHFGWSVTQLTKGRNASTQSKCTLLL